MDLWHFTMKPDYANYTVKRLLRHLECMQHFAAVERRTSTTQRAG